MIQMLVKVNNNHPDIKVKAQETRKLIKYVSNDERMHTTTGEISVIFAEDDYLRKLHKDYLKDGSFTDVMSFNLSDNDNSIEGEIYISLDRAKYYARKFKVSFASEIARLIIHGLLHLKGYDDSTHSKRKEMRQKEDHYLIKYFDSLKLL